MKKIGRLILNFALVGAIAFGVLTVLNAPSVGIAQETTPERYPDELVLLASAVSLHLRGQPEAIGDAPIIFMEKAYSEINKGNIGPLGSMVMEELVLTNWAPSELDGRMFIAGGFFKYLADDGRRQAVRFVAEYGVPAKTMVVRNLSLEVASPPIPDTMSFVVPQSFVLPPDSFGSFERSLEYFASVAIPPEKVAAMTDFSATYSIVSFVVNRLSSDAKLGFKYSDNENGGGGQELSTRTFSINGWSVAITDVKFGAGDPTFYKLVYVPGDDTSGDFALPRSIAAVPATF